MPDIEQTDQNSVIDGNIPEGVDLSGLSQSRFNFNYRMFPSDLTASYYGGHYMVININVPVNPFTGQPRTTFGAGTLTGELSKVDTAKYGTPAEQLSYGLTPTPSGEAQRESLSVPRFTRRIAESIALFMPSSMIHTNQNIYEEVSLTALGGRVASVGLAALVAGGGPLSGRSVQSALQSGVSAARVLDSAGRMISQVASLAKYPINPRVEILFSTTPQKQYVFEVLMAPRNEYESEAIKSIIKTLRIHAAPGIGSGSVNGGVGAAIGGTIGALAGLATGRSFGSAAVGGLAGAAFGGLATSLGPGLTFVPPSEFDITFYQNGRENTNIPKINTCVMEKIEVDYSPTGGMFSTFRNGHPVAVRLSMAFREVEIPHKARIEQGF